MKKAVLGCVYLLRNLINGKGYVGQHKKIEPHTRVLRHFARAKNTLDSRPLYRALRKYKRAGRAMLKAHAIDPTFRIRVGAPQIGRKDSEETRRKKSEGHKGKKQSKGCRKALAASIARRIESGEYFSAQGRANLSAGQRRRYERPEEREKASLAAKSRPPVSLATRKKLSVASTGRKYGPMSAAQKLKLSWAMTKPENREARFGKVKTT